MKYNVGDRVQVKSLDWYNENKGPFGELCPDFIVFLPSRSKYCGQIMTVKEVLRNSYNSDLIYYKMIEDAQLNDWTNGMIEGLVEEEMKMEDGLLDEYEELTDRAFKGGYEKCKSDIELNGFQLPEGYRFVDENGNEILTNKIILEKKKKEYPKTYAECCKILGYSGNYNLILTTDVDNKLFNALYRLKVCRDAYWKIAGEEMGLDGPWEPDWNNISDKYCIYFVSGDVWSKECQTRQCPFAFPTPEMRDAFKENFDPDIEFCKELL